MGTRSRLAVACMGVLALSACKQEAVIRRSGETQAFVAEHGDGAIDGRWRGRLRPALAATGRPRPRRSSIEGDFGEPIRYKDDVVTIQVQSVYIDHIPWTLTGAMTGSVDVILFAEVWENAARGYNTASLNSVVFVARDQKVPGRLNFVGNLAYGPTNFKGHPLKVKFTLMVLQKRKAENLGTAADTLGTIISSTAAATPYGALASQAVSVARELLRNQPDVEAFDFEVTFLSDDPRDLSPTILEAGGAGAQATAIVRGEAPSSPRGIQAVAATVPRAGEPGYSRETLAAARRAEDSLSEFTTAWKDVLPNTEEADWVLSRPAPEDADAAWALLRNADNADLRERLRDLRESRASTMTPLWKAHYFSEQDADGAGNTPRPESSMGSPPDGAVDYDFSPPLLPDGRIVVEPIMPRSPRVAAALERALIAQDHAMEAMEAISDTEPREVTGDKPRPMASPWNQTTLWLDYGVYALIETEEHGSNWAYETEVARTRRLMGLGFEGDFELDSGWICSPRDEADARRRSQQARLDEAEKEVARAYATERQARVDFDVIESRVIGAARARHAAEAAGAAAELSATRAAEQTAKEALGPVRLKLQVAKAGREAAERRLADIRREGTGPGRWVSRSGVDVPDDRLHTNYIVFSITPGQIAQQDGVLLEAARSNAEYVARLAVGDQGPKAIVTQMTAMNEELAFSILKSRAESVARAAAKEAQHADPAQRAETFARLFSERMKTFKAELKDEKLESRVSTLHDELAAQWKSRLSALPR